MNVSCVSLQMCDYLRHCGVKEADLLMLQKGNVGIP